MITNRLSRMPIRYHLRIITVLVAGIPLSLFFAYSWFDASRHIREFEERRLQQISEILSYSLAVPLDFNDIDQIRFVINRAVLLDPRLRIVLEDTTGNVLFEAEGTQFLERIALVAHEVTFDRPIVSDTGAALGTLSITTDIASVVYQQVGKILLGVVGVIILGAAMTYTVGRYFEKQLSDPLHQLAMQMSMTEGDLEGSAHISGGGALEISFLADAFTQMLQRLKQSQEDLRAREKALRTLVRNVPVGLLRISKRSECRLVGVSPLEVRETCEPCRTVCCEVTRANPAAAQILGFADETALVGTFFPDLVEDTAAWHEICQRLAAHGTFRDAELVLRRPDGERVVVRFSASQERGADFMDCTIQDITAEKEVERLTSEYQDRLERTVEQRTAELTSANEQLKRQAEVLRQRNEELKNFAYIVSHDLRAPLVNIKGFAAELRELLYEVAAVALSDTNTPEERKKRLENLQQEVLEALSFIEKSATRMDTLLTAILNLSRLGRRELHMERLPLEEVVQEVLDTLRHQLSQRDIPVHVETLPEVYGDRNALRQVFQNLLENAIKYSHPARRNEIHIWAQQEGEHAVIHVDDKGRGISEADCERVFEIFRRVGPTDVPGEGMGLAYVQTIVRRHGGEVWCRPLDEGTRFSVRLPMYAGASLSYAESV